MTGARVLIADDHPIFRQGLHRTLEGSSRIETIFEAGNGLEALRRIEQDKPDIAILDIAMPEMSGLDVVQRATELNCPVEFVVLTMYREQEYFDAAMEAGVRGYLLKESASTDLIECVESVLDGRYYVSASMSEFLVKRAQRRDALQRQKPGLGTLTATERQVLRLIAENLTSKEIGERMHISYRTVQNHRANMCAKLGLEGYNKLLEFALHHKSTL